MVRGWQLAEVHRAGIARSLINRRELQAALEKSVEKEKKFTILTARHAGVWRDKAVIWTYSNRGDSFVIPTELRTMARALEYGLRVRNETS